jgi:hypothetical protein
VHAVVRYPGFFPKYYEVESGRFGEELLAKLVADHAVADNDDGRSVLRCHTNQLGIDEK